MITFIYLPKSSVSLLSVKTVVEGKDYASTLTKAQRDHIDKEWKIKVDKNPKMFSKPNGLGTFIEYDKTAFKFQPTEFKTYAAMPEGMKISAIGGVILLKDDVTIIRKRPEQATHAGMLDASFSGFVHVDNGVLALERSVRDKLVRDFNFKDNIEIRLTAVHTETAHDHSCMFDFVVKINMTKEQFGKLMTPDVFKQCTFLKQSEVPNFLATHAKEMLGDGIACLLASLPLAMREPAIKSVRDAGISISQ